jgi:hypothetical protein
MLFWCSQIVAAEAESSWRCYQSNFIVLVLVLPLVFVACSATQGRMLLARRGYGSMYWMRQTAFGWSYGTASLQKSTLQCLSACGSFRRRTKQQNTKQDKVRLLQFVLLQKYVINAFFRLYQALNTACLVTKHSTALADCNLSSVGYAMDSSCLAVSNLSPKMLSWLTFRGKCG